MKKNRVFQMKKSTFIEGTLIATLAIIVTKILGMLYVIPFYAMVGTKGSALYAYAYNIYIIFLDISAAGIPIAMSKLIKEYHTLGYMDAKIRAYKIGKKLVCTLSLVAFLLVFFFAKSIAFLILGDLQGGNTIEDVAVVIRFVSLAILVIPYLSVTKGYLQGHNIINIPSYSQVLEQFVRILVILLGSYLCLKVFHLPLEISVGIAVSGAFIGGLVAILYIKKNMQSQKEKIFESTEEKQDFISDKDIQKKIISYAIPFIIIDIATSLYNFIDMVLLSRTMTHLGFDATTTEFITSSVATWAGKIGNCVTSIAMGLIVSLIPSMVEACTLAKWNMVENRFNKALQIILFCCIPMMIGISLLARPIWSIFYGSQYLELGENVLQFYIYTTIFVNLYMVSTSTLQSLNKFKNVYQTTLLGYVTNAILDVPFMFLFYSLGYSPFIGTIFASILGYGVSFIMTLNILKRGYHMKFKQTLQVLFKMVLPTLTMTLVVMFFINHVHYDATSKLSCIFYVLFIGLIGACTYLGLSYKQGIIQTIFGKKVQKKLTLKKGSSS